MTGSENARQFAKEIASYGIVIVSGLALGIDAHRLIEAVWRPWGKQLLFWVRELIASIHYDISSFRMKLRKMVY